MGGAGRRAGPGLAPPETGGVAGAGAEGAERRNCSFALV